MIRRDDRPVALVLEHLVGLQAQAPMPPYLGLLSRLGAFDASGSLLLEPAPAVFVDGRHLRPLAQ